MAHEKAVIPVFVDPAFASGFEVGKIHDATNLVLGVARDKKIADVVMAVKVFALAAVLVESVSGAEFNPSHDSQGHGCFGFCERLNSVTVVLDLL